MSVKKITRLYEQLSVDNSSPPKSPSTSSQEPSRSTTPTNEWTADMYSLEFDDYNCMLSSKEIKSLGMSSIELEAEKRGQRWRNLSYVFFKQHHSLTDSELQER